MDTLPIDRTIAIYEALADRCELQGTRERLSKHLAEVFTNGERDQHRLTVHGLSYLQQLYRQRDFG